MTNALGLVHHYQTSTGKWIVEFPDGSILDVARSPSTTSGVQEALLYCKDNAWHLRTIGRPATSGCLVCTTNLSVIGFENFSWQLMNANITFDTAFSQDGITLDACNNCDFDFGGYSNYHGTGAQLKIKTIKTTRLRVQNFIINASGPTCNVNIDISSAGLADTQNHFDFGNLYAEGAGQTSLAPVNLLVSGGGAAAAFRGNKIRIGSMLGASDAGLKIINATDAAGGGYNACNTNKWDIGAIWPIGTNAVGIKTDGSLDEFNVGAINNNEGTFAHGVVFTGNAFGNKAFVGSIAGNTGDAVVDGGVSSNYWITNTATKLPGMSSGGATFIVGAGVPASGTGNNGDMALNSTTGDLYGPKSAGAWGSTVANIKGPTGASGATGATGPAGSGGSNVLDTQNITTAQASIQHTTGINSSNRFYEQKLSELVSSTDDVALLCHIGNSGGMKTSSGNYSWQYAYKVNGGSLTSANSASDTAIHLTPSGSGLGMHNSSIYGLSGSIWFDDPTNSPQKLRWNFEYRKPSGDLVEVEGSADYLGGGFTMTSIEVLASSGNIVGFSELLGS